MADVYAWRDHLAGTLHESPATCNQGVSAIKFLFEKVIDQKWEDNPLNPIRLKLAQKTRRRVISKPDLLKFFEKLNARDRLIAHLMYAGVMRLSDVIRTRVKDFNFDDELIELAETKHSHFRMVPFPKSLHEAVKRQLDSVRVVHKFDEFDNPNGVPVGYSFAKKTPSAPRDLRWYWTFPSDTLSRDPDDNRLKRFHLDKGNIRRRFAAAIRAAGITRRMTPHDLRRVAATHLHLDGMPLTKLQGILGHNSIEQTRDYIMDGESNLTGSDSPFDKLMASG
jgi:integrase